MKLENQVCSLELAKRLKELGVKQDSSWYWVGFDENLTSENNFCLFEKAAVKGRNYYSAFTVAELGEMLPEGAVTIKAKDGYGNTTWKPFRHKHTSYNLGEDFTEANARAKMLVYLLENKLIKVEGIK